MKTQEPVRHLLKNILEILSKFDCKGVEASYSGFNSEENYFYCQAVESPGKEVDEDSLSRINDIAMNLVELIDEDYKKDECIDSRMIIKFTDNNTVKIVIQDIQEETAIEEYAPEKINDIKNKYFQECITAFQEIRKKALKNYKNFNLFVITQESVFFKSGDTVIFYEPTDDENETIGDCYHYYHSRYSGSDNESFPFDLIIDLENPSNLAFVYYAEVDDTKEINKKEIIINI